MIGSDSSGLDLRTLIVQLVVFTFGGVLLGTGLAFILAVLSKTIKYSFTYGWNSDELFLEFDEGDSAKLIAHDMLVSDKNNVAVRV
ncbi:MAG: hypothetical protein U5K84_06550 [Alkalibacterium sp.]|nr:hypothetical protein [Alkalibacterium sp.]